MIWVSTKQRVRLLHQEQNGKCCYCGVVCDFKSEGIRISKNNPAPEWMATLEHVYDNYDIRRLVSLQLPFRLRNKMACYRCNNQRGVDRLKEMEPIYDLMYYDIRSLCRTNDNQ